VRTDAACNNAKPTDGPGVPPDDLLPLVYEELRELARCRMAEEKPNHTLQATALVHEAYLRLASGGEARFANRAHFFHAAAEAMRRILIERARRRGRVKHGGGRRPVPLNVLDFAVESDSEQILAFDEAIRRLEDERPLAAVALRLRFFGGLTVEETAEAMGTSPRTVNREWTFARAWLFRILQ
jgi:RNA polymerase sigma factor (TIGR02999 family)